MIRSSAGVGSPRPSWFDVVTHSVPSGAVTTVRSRPWSSVKNAVGRTARPSPVTYIRHSRWPRSPAIDRALRTSIAS